MHLDPRLKELVENQYRGKKRLAYIAQSLPSEIEIARSYHVKKPKRKKSILQERRTVTLSSPEKLSLQALGHFLPHFVLTEFYSPGMVQMKFRMPDKDVIRELLHFKYGQLVEGSGVYESLKVNSQGPNAYALTSWIDELKPPFPMLDDRFSYFLKNPFFTLLDKRLQVDAKSFFAGVLDIYAKRHTNSKASGYVKTATLEQAMEYGNATGELSRVKDYWEQYLSIV